MTSIVVDYVGVGLFVRRLPKFEHPLCILYQDADDKSILYRPVYRLMLETIDSVSSPGNQLI